MFCSFNTPDNKRIYIAFVQALTAKMNAAIFNPDATFDVEQVMKDVFERTMARTSDYEQSVNNARMVPSIISGIINRDISKLAALTPKGLKVDKLFDLRIKLESEESGIAQTESVLGIDKDILNKAKNASEGKPTVKRTRKKPVERKIPEGSVARDQLTLFDEEGNPIPIGEKGRRRITNLIDEKEIDGNS